MTQEERSFLRKALQSLEGAASEFSNRRYDNCANRSYYACFQAAIYALQEAGITARSGLWGHDYVPAQFEGQLINRRHRFGTELRGVLENVRALRWRADYYEDTVSRTEAERALRRTQRFVNSIQGGEPQ